MNRSPADADPLAGQPLTELSPAEAEPEPDNTPPPTASAAAVTTSANVRFMAPPPRGATVAPRQAKSSATRLVGKGSAGCTCVALAPGRSQNGTDGTADRRGVR